MRGEKKRLLDAIKVTASNAFYQAFASFQEAYSNYRDDHVWFRHLTSSGGVIVEQSGQTICYLVSVAEYPKRLRRIISAYLEELSAKAQKPTNGSEAPIRVILGYKSGIKLALPNLPEPTET